MVLKIRGLCFNAYFYLMIRTKHAVFFVMSLLTLCISRVSYAGGDEIKIRKQSKFSSRRPITEKSLLDQLSIIEKQHVPTPENNISKLELIIKQAIIGNHHLAKTKAYWLMAKTYKNLQQGPLALKFMNLALKEQQNGFSFTKKETTIRSANKKMDLKIKENSPVLSDSPLEIHDSIIPSEKALLSNKKIKQRVPSTSSGTRSNTSSFTSEVSHQTLPNTHLEDMAEIQILLGNYELANEYYSKYQSLVKPDTQRIIQYKIAQNLYAAKKYELALTSYEQLLITETNNEKKALCNARIAGCKISLGDTQEGLNAYQNSMSQSNYSMAAEEASDEDYIEFYSNKEVVTKALRDQNKFEEEANLRNDIVEITKDKLEYLKLAQSYHQVGKLQEAEKSLDQYLLDISYEILDEQEIKVLKDLAVSLSKSGNTKKAYQYLVQYENISDSIEIRINKIRGFNSRIGKSGVQHILDLKILQKDKELSDNMIAHLVNEQALQEKSLGFQKTIIYLLSFIIFVSLGTTAYIIKVSKQRRIANQQLAIRSLRSQMNPHFIFNALNSVNSFISMNDELAANKFLSEFSTLMRSVMENSEHNFIPLTKELEITKLYLGLEHYRFKDKFQYELIIDDQLDQDEMQLPPMLIQPYIENSIWHGLRYKETQGELIVSFKKQENNLVVTIQDNGIGRTKSHELKTKNQKKNKSTAIKNIDQRITLISALHHIKVMVHVEDLQENGSGTKTTLTIPQISPS